MVNDGSLRHPPTHPNNNKKKEKKGKVLFQERSGNKNANQVTMGIAR